MTLSADHSRRCDSARLLRLQDCSQRANLTSSLARSPSPCCTRRLLPFVDSHLSEGIIRCPGSEAAYAAKWIRIQGSSYSAPLDWTPRAVLAPSSHRHRAPSPRPRVPPALKLACSGRTSFGVIARWTVTPATGLLSQIASHSDNARHPHLHPRRLRQRALPD